MFLGLATSTLARGPNWTLRTWKQRAFAVRVNSTSGRWVTWTNPATGRKYSVYSNVNLSVYSARACNADCGFCVEKLRPASVGVAWEESAPLLRKRINDAEYFHKLDRALSWLEPLDPSVSVTGGEPSLDPRLPQIVALLARHHCRKRTLTSNGTGFRDPRLLRLLVDAGFAHLNLSRAHYDEEVNAKLMGLEAGLLSNGELERIAQRLRGCRLRPRLSCVLQRGGVASERDALEYLDWAAAAGFDNVVFRQLMDFDPASTLTNRVALYCQRHRVPVAKVTRDLSRLLGSARFRFVKQVVGYYYYVEVFRYWPVARRAKFVDVVFEEADLSFIDRDRAKPRVVPVVHELVFHPNGRTCSTWHPWKGFLF
ncbi:MAG: hypothetical protein Kow0069_33270 [Promethearchaeota archaeon]